MGHLTNAQEIPGGAYSPPSVMTPGAGWFFGRKGRVLHADAKGGAVLWPKGQGPPHLIRASSQGLCERSRLSSVPHSAASGSLVPPDPPNMGHLTNGRSAHTALD